MAVDRGDVRRRGEDEAVETTCRGGRTTRIQSPQHRSISARPLPLPPLPSPSSSQAGRLSAVAVSLRCACCLPRSAPLPPRRGSRCGLAAFAFGIALLSLSLSVSPSSQLLSCDRVAEGEREAALGRRRVQAGAAMTNTKQMHDTSHVSSCADHVAAEVDETLIIRGACRAGRNNVGVNVHAVYSLFVLLVDSQMLEQRNSGCGWVKLAMAQRSDLVTDEEAQSLH